jgi:hypothetical protein
VIVVDVSALLDRRGVPHAVIGAVALAVHGVPRATADVDVLVTDPRCLDATWWESFVAAGATVDVRRGDAEDPLAGVVVVLQRSAPPSRGPTGAHAISAPRSFRRHEALGADEIVCAVSAQSSRASAKRESF